MDSGALIRSLTHIQGNLDGDLSLRAVASAAGCSAPYFVRRFSAAMAETPGRYIARLRLERAALRLVLLEDSILRVALDCGFSCHETFCRAFRRRFGVSPSEYRRRPRRGRRGGAPEVPQRAAAAEGVSLSSTVVRTLRPMSLAFIRHTGPYEAVPIGLWDSLIEWAKRRGIPSPYVLMGIAHDAPGITKPEHLRFDAAIRVPGEFRSGRRVGHQRFAGGLFALTTHVGPLSALPAAYGEVFRRWDRRLACLGVPCVEFYRVNRVVAGPAIVETEIAVPVRRR